MDLHAHDRALVELPITDQRTHSYIILSSDLKPAQGHLSAVYPQLGSSICVIVGRSNVISLFEPNFAAFISVR